MKITSSNIEMAANHFSATESATKTHLEIRQPARENSSPTAKIRQNATAPSAQVSASDTYTGNDEALDPKLSLIRDLIARLTGRFPKLFAGFEATAPTYTNSGTVPSANFTTNASPSISYQETRQYAEYESTQFSANGVINTADGKQINFTIDIAMERSYFESSSLSLKMGAAPETTDPLVLNFNGTAAALSNQRFAFDLNADGQTTEQINQLVSGSGFLSFDKNGDGKINNGAELFGALTGNGFQELAALDDDKNGWIDENDAAFSQLSVWQPAGDGQTTLQSLTEAGVGAIYLGHVATPFSIKNEQNDLLGQIRSTGVFLNEDGSSGSINQIDLTV